jgi:hypothetical protein
MKSSKQKSGNRVQECFVLVYDALEDPSTEQTAEALDQLSSFETEEVVPGTIRVVGPRVDIERVADDLKSKSWNLSEEKLLSSEPPFKSQID